MAKQELDADYFYFCEETSQIDPKTFDYKKRSEAGTWWLVFPARVHYFDIINRNNRGYLRKNVEEFFFSPKNVDLMNHNRWFGEADHPFDMYETLKLTRKRVEKVYWPNRTHKLTKPNFTDSYLDLVIETCSGTEVGRGMANDIIQGMIPGFSCRSCGQLQIINAKPIVMISKLITYDTVPFSGFENADAIAAPTAKSKTIVTEEGHEARSHRDVMIPVKDLLDDLAKVDEKVYAYMEAADGDITGGNLTADGKLHLNNNGLHIYAGVDQYSLGMVKDFYRSFRK